MDGPMHTYFLGLTAVGFDALWGSMMRNGTAKAIGAVKASGILSDGNILKQIYTTIPSVDKFLLSPVIFYDALTREGNPTYRSLLVSLFSTMQTTSFCMIFNGLNGEKKSSWGILESLFWGVLNQSYGAAFVYPLYFLTHLRQITVHPIENPATRELSTADAEALLYTSIVASLLPVWLVYPAVFSCSSETRQNLIAYYRATPAILAVTQPIIAAIIRRVRATPLSNTWSRPLLQSSLYLSGAFAAFGHLYAIASAITSPLASLRGVFSPWDTVVDSSAKSVIAQGCHLFLQNDWWVISAAVIPYAALILRSSRRTTIPDDTQSWYAWVDNKLHALDGKLVTLTAMTALLSPGAVLAWTMATRV